LVAKPTELLQEIAGSGVISFIELFVPPCGTVLSKTMMPQCAAQQDTEKKLAMLLLHGGRLKTAETLSRGSQGGAPDSLWIALFPLDG
jgi:hypothetical protein